MNTENNKLIAEFTRRKYFNHPIRVSYNDGKSQARTLAPEQFIPNFHSDWNCLMEVVKKIREVVNTELSANDFDKHRGLEQRLNPYTYDITSIYNGCVEFIKWYNQQPQSDESK